MWWGIDFTGLSPRIGGKTFVKFNSKDAISIGKKILVGKILANGSQFTKFTKFSPATELCYKVLVTVTGQPKKSK